MMKAIIEKTLEFDLDECGEEQLQELMERAKNLSASYTIEGRKVIFPAQELFFDVEQYADRLGWETEYSKLSSWFLDTFEVCSEQPFTSITYSSEQGQLVVEFE